MGKTRAECSQNAYTSAFLSHWIQILANSSPKSDIFNKQKKKNPTLFFRILRSVGRGQHNTFFFLPNTAQAASSIFTQVYPPFCHRFARRTSTAQNKLSKQLWRRERSGLPSLPHPRHRTPPPSPLPSSTTHTPPTTQYAAVSTPHHSKTSW